MFRPCQWNRHRLGHGWSRASTGPLWRLSLPFAAALLAAQTLAASVHAEETWQYPIHLAVSGAGRLLVVDRDLPGIWEVTEKGDRELHYRGSRKLRTPLNAIRCIAIDHEGAVIAGDSATREIYRFDKDCVPQPLTGGAIGIPMGIAVTRAGDLVVADLEQHRLCRVPAAGGKPETIAQVAAPRALTIDSEDRLWLISDAPKRGEREVRQILRVSLDGRQETIVAGRAFAFPGGIAVDDQNTIYVADSYARVIWRMQAGGVPERWIEGEPLQYPVGLAWRKGGLLIADPRAKCLLEASSEAKLRTFAR